MSNEELRKRIAALEEGLHELYEDKAYSLDFAAEQGKKPQKIYKDAAESALRHADELEERIQAIETEIEEMKKEELKK